MSVLSIIEEAYLFDGGQRSVGATVDQMVYILKTTFKHVILR